MKLGSIFDEITNEVLRACDKFPAWPDDPLHAVTIVQEECGELSKATLQCVYEPHKAALKDVRAEAIQTAAMAVRFLLSLERYEWERSKEHRQ